MKKLIICFLLLLSCCAYAEVINYGSWRLHIIKDIKPWPSKPYLIGVDGQKVSIESGYDDKFLLVVFWATWCPHCINNDKMSDLDAFASELKKFGVRVVAISEDHAGIDKPKLFFEQHNISNITLLLDDGAQMLQTIGLRGIPAGFLLDKSRNILMFFDGIPKWKDKNIRRAILQQVEQ